MREYFVSILLTLLLVVIVVNAVVGIVRRDITLKFSRFTGKVAVGMGIFALVFSMWFLFEVVLPSWGIRL